jgi:predicted RND superfamily exporter protein
MPKDDPEVTFLNETGERFGSNYVALIAIEADNIFTYRYLSTIRKLTNECEKVPGVRNVMSLTNVIDVKKVEGGVEVGKLIDQDHVPKSPEELARLREYTLGKEFYVGNIVSKDGRAAAVIVRMKDNVNKEKVAAVLKEAAHRIAGDQPVYFGGFPMVMEYCTHIIAKDIKKLIPMVITLIVIILFLSFGTLRGVVLPLMTVICATLLTLAVMALLKIPLTIISSVMPVVLIATGTAYGIHMMNKYYEDVKDEKGKLKGMSMAIREVGTPIILTGLTTLVGFLSLLVSDLTLIRQFGFFTALGIFFALLLSIFFIPSVLSILPFRPQKKQQIGSKEGTYVERMMDALGAFVFKREKTILITTGLVAVLAVIFIPRMSRDVNLVNYFPEESEPRVSETLMKERFGGSQFLVVDFRADDVKNPLILKEIELLKKYMRVVSNVKYPQSIADLIAETNGVMNDRYSIPTSRHEVENLWIFLDGQDILGQMINNQYTEMLLYAKIDELDSEVANRVVKEIRRIIKEGIRSDLVIVERKAFFGPTLNDILSHKAKEIETRIRLDLQYHGVTSPEGFTLYDDLMSIMIQPDSMPVPKDILIPAMGKYFLSDCADIEIEDPKLRTHIIEALTGLSDHSIETITRTLQQEIPPSLYNDDPEAIEYMAMSLEALSKDLRLEQQSIRLTSNLGERLGIDLNDPLYRELYRDLKGDLWGVNESQIALAIADFEKITGLKPSPEEIIRFKTHLTGLPPLFIQFESELIKSQIQSVALAIVVVLILLMLQLRSLIVGLLAMIPIVFTILVNFGVMSAFGLPLDNATMMIASIAIGIGIDYTIHFISRFKRELPIQNSELEALERTLETTGKAILINTVAVMLGFAVLFFSEMLPIKRFGYLTALTMLVSAAGAITVFPAAVLGIKPAVLNFSPKIIRQIMGGKNNKKYVRV